MGKTAFAVADYKVTNTLAEMTGMEKITYHPLVLSDYSELFAFWKSMNGIVMHQDFSESLEGFALFLNRNTGLSTVARYCDAIVGAVLCSHDGRRGYLNHLAVSKDHQRKGVGKELVLRSLRLLKSQHIYKTTVPVLKSNAEGQQFWSKIGFVKEAIIEMHSIISR